ncbi:MAG TPA: SDR family NAD(P)-dependent oxidoreductase [Steroidobacteraceae bacterium]
MHRFAGQVVIVTGAANGIGLGIASAFCHAGAIVHGFDIDAAALQRAALALEASPGRFQPATVDICDANAIASSVAHVQVREQRIDVVVNNAGINMNKRIADLQVPEWHRALDTNLTSVYLMCRAVWPTFTRQRRGNIINISSVMGQVGGVTAPAYCASKAGIIMLSRCLAKDGASFGIRVNSICPGYIDTPIMDRLLAEQSDPGAARRQILERQPLGRLGTPADIAQGAMFLASDAASFVSGTELTIDGAVTATQID